MKIWAESNIEDIEIAEIKVTGIENEDKQESIIGRDSYKEDEKSGLTEVNVKF